MTQTRALEIAQAGDVVKGSDLQKSIDLLNAMCKQLERQVSNASDVQAIQALNQAHSKLQSKAQELVHVQIKLLVGQAKVTAEHINDAIHYASEAIQDIADVRKLLEKIGALLDFVGVALLGDGRKILQAAITLKSKLDQA